MEAAYIIIAIAAFITAGSAMIKIKSHEAEGHGEPARPLKPASHRDKLAAALPAAAAAPLSGCAGGTREITAM